jgi:hypothetical protein
MIDSAGTMAILLDIGQFYFYYRIELKIKNYLRPEIHLSEHHLDGHIGAVGHR